MICTQIDGRLSEAQSVGGCSPPGEEFAQQRGQLTREMGEKIFSGHIEKDLSEWGSN